ncbi:MAG: ABC transporter permease [Gemmatimonadetes bacterium]|nr:ABC transporter permease [Gemmatimonadota bacterium]
MADMRWRKVWRDASLHLPRAVLVASAVAIALAGAGTVLVSWALVRRATVEGYHASDPPAATLRLSRVTPEALAIARATDGVRDAQARRTMGIPLQVRGTWHSAVVFAVDDPSAVRIGKLSAAGGTWPAPDGAFAIERSSVDFAGVVLGDSVTTIGSDSALRAVSVAGFVRDVGLAPGWMEHVVYAWTSTRTLAMLGLPAEPNELQLLVTDRAPTRAGVTRVAAEVRHRLEGAGLTAQDVDVPEPGEHIHAAQMDSLLMTQVAFGILALVVGAFLITNLLAAMLAGEVRQVGIMKTLGADPSQLRSMYLAFGGLLGALATAIALPVALVLGRRYAALRGEMLNFDIAAYGIPWWAILGLVAVGLGLPVVAAWFPVRHGVRIPVAVALRDLGIVDDVQVATFPSLGGWSRVLALSLRNAFRRRRRMVLTMLTLATGGAVFIATGNLRRAVIGSMDLIYGSQRYAFSVRLAQGHDGDSLLRVVRGVEGVTSAEAWTSVRASLATPAGGVEDLPVVGVPPGSALLALTLTDDGCVPFDDARPCRATARPLVVSRSTQRVIPGLARGDSLALTVQGVSSWWTVTAIFEGGPAPQAYTTSAAAAAARDGARPGTVVVATELTGLALQVDLISRVRSALEGAGLPVVSTQRVEESRRVTEDHLLMVVQFLGAMGWVMILVGGMGLASTMALAVLERTREIGVMRAIGAGHGSIFSLIQVEGLTISLLGWLVAVPLSLPFSLTLGEAFSRIMFRVPVHLLPSGGHIGTWLGVTLLVSVISCAWPAWRAMRSPAARALSSI